MKVLTDKHVAELRHVERTMLACLGAHGRACLVVDSDGGGGGVGGAGYTLTTDGLCIMASLSRLEAGARNPLVRLLAAALDSHAAHNGDGVKTLAVHTITLLSSLIAVDSHHQSVRDHLRLACLEELVEPLRCRLLANLSNQLDVTRASSAKSKSAAFMQVVPRVAALFELEHAQLGMAFGSRIREASIGLIGAYVNTLDDDECVAKRLRTLLDDVPFVVRHSPHAAASDQRASLYECGFIVESPKCATRQWQFAQQHSSSLVFMVVEDDDECASEQQSVTISGACATSIVDSLQAERRTRRLDARLVDQLRGQRQQPVVRWLLCTRRLSDAQRSQLAANGIACVEHVERDEMVFLARKLGVTTLHASSDTVDDSNLVRLERVDLLDSDTLHFVLSPSSPSSYRAPMAFMHIVTPIKSLFAHARNSLIKALRSLCAAYESAHLSDVLFVQCGGMFEAHAARACHQLADECMLAAHHHHRIDMHLTYRWLAEHLSRVGHKLRARLCSDDHQQLCADDSLPALPPTSSCVVESLHSQMSCVVQALRFAQTVFNIDDVCRVVKRRTVASHDHDDDDSD